jgi:hypothetical protein
MLVMTTPPIGGRQHVMEPRPMPADSAGKIAASATAKARQLVEMVA